MSDGFEYQYFGTITGNDPNADPDHDGMTNVQEYLAGTSPINANSNLRISSIQRSGNLVTLTWPSVAGKTYRVLYADNLASAFAPISGVLTASGTSMNYSDPASTPNRFYKVEVVVPPGQ